MCWRETSSENRKTQHLAATVSKALKASGLSHNWYGFLGQGRCPCLVGIDQDSILFIEFIFKQFNFPGPVRCDQLNALCVVIGLVRLSFGYILVWRCLVRSADPFTDALPIPVEILQVSDKVHQRATLRTRRKMNLWLSDININLSVTIGNL